MATAPPGTILPSRIATRPMLVEPFHAAIDAVEKALEEEGLLADKLDHLINQLRRDTESAVVSFLKSLSSARADRDRGEIYGWIDVQLVALENELKNVSSMTPDWLALIAEFRRKADETFIGRYTPVSLATEDNEVAR